jgi:peptidoglycan/xylan/chitin deacetylase (PgdA/CDA1 family)
MMHLGLKFPGAALIAGALYFTLAEDTTPMVAITFDDGRASVYAHALPAVEEYGWPATMYIPTDFINREGYVSTEQIQNLVVAEWEIGAHGIDHTSFTEMSDIQLFDQLMQPVQVLSEISGQEILSVASPYGQFDEHVLENIEKMYFSHVNAWSTERGLNTAENFDEYNVHRLDVTYDVSHEEVCEVIYNLPEDSLFVFVVHHITDIPGIWNTPIWKLEEILKCIDDAGVNVVRASDGIQAMVIKQ